MATLYLGVTLCGLVGGICITLAQLFQPLVWGSVLVACVGVLVFWQWRFASVSPWVVGVALFCVALVGGALRAEWQQQSLAAGPPITTPLRGQVVSYPDRRPAGTQFYLETPTGTRVLVKGGAYSEVTYGSVVLVMGDMTVPAPFSTDHGRVFRYDRYLATRGVTVVVEATDITLAAPPTWSLLGSLFIVRSRFVEGLFSVVPPPYGQLGAGLLLGERGGLPPALYEAFRQSGLVHIIVLSGYNLLLIVGFVLWLGSWVWSYRVRLVAAAGFVVLFALMVDGGASVMRATVMVLAMLTSLFLARGYAVWPVLLVAAGVMLGYNPLFIYDVGFQLSFAATTGLVLAAPQFETLLAAAPRFLGLRDIVIATIATQVAVAPLLLFHVGELSVVALITNLVVLPLVPVAMLLSFVSGVVALVVPVLALPIGAMTTLLLAGIVLVAEMAAALPVAVFTVPPFPWWWVVVLYATMVGVGMLWHRPQSLPVV